LAQVLIIDRSVSSESVKVIQLPAKRQAISGFQEDLERQIFKRCVWLMSGRSQDISKAVFQFANANERRFKVWFI
jgi:hypothetical protein